MDILLVVGAVLAALFGGWNAYQNKKMKQQVVKEKNELLDKVEKDKVREADVERKAEKEKARENKEKSKKKDPVGFVNDLVRSRKK